VGVVSKAIAKKQKQGKKTPKNLKPKNKNAYSHIFFLPKF
jgi:hypothetical protein